jgi:hypothetical protein
MLVPMRCIPTCSTPDKSSDYILTEGWFKISRTSSGAQAPQRAAGRVESRA